MATNVQTIAGVVGVASMSSSHEQDFAPTLLGKADRILQVLPEDGSTLTPRRIAQLIRERFGSPLSDEDYVAARNHMVALGRIVCRPGRGGSVKRAAPVESLDEELSFSNDWHIEANLYAPVKLYVRLAFWRDPHVNLNEDVFVSITGDCRPPAGGRWAVPDLVMAHRRDLSMLRESKLEVTTFEVKTQRNIDERAPQQAATQAVGAHRAYLVWHCADEGLRMQKLRRLLPLCEQSGVGLIITSDPRNFSSYKIERPARLRNPEAVAVDDLLGCYIGKEDRPAFDAWSARFGRAS